MNRWNGKLKITLKSDLCVGSGYSFAGIIDSDICYDDCGFPYIPAKRIKGCLREAYETLLYSVFDTPSNAVFGKAGDAAPGDLLLGNAYIENYDYLHSAVLKKRETSEAAELYSAQEILGQYTHVIGQTRIEESGVADDGSLRFTRVTGQYDPVRSRIAGRPCEAVYYADISVSEPFRALLEASASATRHIGMKRNRGFGNIVCELVDDQDTETAGGQVQVTYPDEGTAGIAYCIVNEDALLLSSANENKSETFISAQSVLGALAARYLKEPGNSADSETFRDLFLNGSVKYTNAYPSDGRHIYYPVPEYLNQLKKTKKYVNMLGLQKNPDEKKTGEYDPSHGNQPKKLRGKYVYLDDAQIGVTETESEIAYHHRHHGTSDRSEDDALLYGVETICPNQQFAGEIIAPKKYEQIIRNLMKDGCFRFGKSKSSQYGRCRLTSAENLITGQSLPKLNKGDHLVITLLSDAIFLNRNGEYTVYEDEVKRIVAGELGIPADFSDNSYYSGIITGTATGYLSVWNLRKPAVPCIKAGSYLVFSLAESYEPKAMFAGERSLEGYGQIRYDRAEDFSYAVQKPVVKNDITHSRTSAVTSEGTQQLKALMTPILKEAWLNERKQEVLDGRKMDISSSALGRLTLMLKEACEACPDNPAAAKDNFKERVDSIKTEKVRKTGEEILKKVEKNLGNPKALDEAAIKELKALGADDREIRTMAADCWSELLMKVLTEQKYRMKGEDK